MSGPKRGMVAGQPIVSQAQTQAFDEGFDRTFGERKRERGRFIYRDGQCIPVDADWTDTSGSGGHRSEAEVYGDAIATDGTPINTRRRLREYLKETGLTHASDYSDAFRAREKALKEQKSRKSTREALARSFYKHTKY